MRHLAASQNFHRSTLRVSHISIFIQSALLFRVIASTDYKSQDNRRIDYSNDTGQSLVSLHIFTTVVPTPRRIDDKIYLEDDDLSKNAKYFDGSIKRIFSNARTTLFVGGYRFALCTHVQRSIQSYPCTYFFSPNTRNPAKHPFRHLRFSPISFTSSSLFVDSILLFTRYRNRNVSSSFPLCQR